MVNEEMEVLLPDGTKLVAKTERNGERPGIILHHINGANDYEEVAFAEYNPENPFGQKLQIGAYRNDDDDCKYYDKFCHCIKPSYKEMLELYENYRGDRYSVFQYDGFIHIQRCSDQAIVYKNFCCDDKPTHIGHQVTLTAYLDGTTPKSIVFMCLDCDEIIYLTQRPDAMREEFRQAKPGMDEVVHFTYKSNVQTKDLCIGYDKVHFFNESNYSTYWVEINPDYKAIGYLHNLNGLYKKLEDDNFYKRVLCSISGDLCEKFIEIGNGQIATKYISGDYTFYIRIVPEESSFVAWIYMYDNQVLYQKIPPFAEEIEGDEYSYILRNITCLDEYRNPRITYLDYVEEECWKLFKEYAEYVGVEIGDGIDFRIAKELSVKFIAMVESTFGIPFPKSKNG